MVLVSSVEPSWQMLNRSGTAAAAAANTCCKHPTLALVVCRRHHHHSRASVSSSRTQSSRPAPSGLQLFLLFVEQSHKEDDVPESLSSVSRLRTTVSLWLQIMTVWFGFGDRRLSRELVAVGLLSQWVRPS